MTVVREWDSAGSCLVRRLFGVVTDQTEKHRDGPVIVNTVLRGAVVQDTAGSRPR